MPSPNLLRSLDELPEALLASGFGLLADFDGTLSEIVPDHTEAAIAPDTAASLRRLASKLTLVAIVSGRSVGDLYERVGEPTLTYVGNHGVEFLRNGHLEVAPGAESSRDAIVGVVDHLKAADLQHQVSWEDKKYSVAGHFRRASDPQGVKASLAEALETAPGVEGLEVFWGSMLIEIRSRLGLDKGHAVRRLVEEHRLAGAIMVGDDRTDVDAWRELRRMTGESKIRGFSVVVVRPESDPEVVAAADYTLDGVAEVAAFLDYLERSAPGAITAM